MTIEINEKFISDIMKNADKSFESILNNIADEKIVKENADLLVGNVFFLCGIISGLLANMDRMKGKK